MKIWRIVSISFLAIISLVFTFTTCGDNDNSTYRNKDNPKCNCTNTEHTGACASPCTGKSIPPCTCTDPPYANIVGYCLTNGLSSIIIRPKSQSGEFDIHLFSEQSATGTSVIYPVNIIKNTDQQYIMVCGDDTLEIEFPSNKSINITNISGNDSLDIFNGTWGW